MNREKNTEPTYKGRVLDVELGGRSLSSLRLLPVPHHLQDGVDVVFGQQDAGTRSKGMGHRYTVLDLIACRMSTSCLWAVWDPYLATIQGDFTEIVDVLLG